MDDGGSEEQIEAPMAEAVIGPEGLTRAGPADEPAEGLGFLPGADREERFEAVAVSERRALRLVDGDQHGGEHAPTVALTGIEPAHSGLRGRRLYQFAYRARSPDR